MTWAKRYFMTKLFLMQMVNYLIANIIMQIASVDRTTPLLECFCSFHYFSYCWLLLGKLSKFLFPVHFRFSWNFVNTLKLRAKYNFEIENAEWKLNLRKLQRKLWQAIKMLLLAIKNTRSILFAIYIFNEKKL